ncbi:MAG: ScyD/ScyE family protein [Dehalococcoidia bacterium]
MSRPSSLTASIGLLVLLGLFGLLAFATATHAQEPAEGSPEEGSYEVFADGLDNPRGLAFGPEGALYVAEAGRGGGDSCMDGPEGGAVCLGMTGAITRVWRGEQLQVITGLPSIAAQGDEETPAGSSAGGPHDIAFQGRGNAVVVIGLGADPAIRETLGDDGYHLGHIIQIPASSRWQSVADIAGYESEANPDEGIVDSNPYSVLAEPGGLVATDAGGNSLLRVDANGDISTLAVFPDRMVGAPPFLGLPPESEIPMQSVPTSVVVGPDGAYYVGELTGFPFEVGGARVYRIEEGGEPEVYAEGFTNIIDIAFNENGELLVLEIATNGLLAEDMAGALKAEDGTVIADGLIMPGGLAVGPDGAYYVSNCGVCAGEGEVLRIEP